MIRRLPNWYDDKLFAWHAKACGMSWGRSTLSPSLPSFPIPSPSPSALLLPREASFPAPFSAIKTTGSTSAWLEALLYHHLIMYDTLYVAVGVVFVLVAATLSGFLEVIQVPSHLVMQESATL